MSIRNRVRSSLMAGVLLALAPVAAQEVVTTGPPPEIRALVTAVMEGLNGSAQAWEAMAKERFAKELLDRQTPQQRQAAHDKLHADFGTVSMDRAIRRGPDAPLELHVKGSTGTTGVITLDITDANPPRIAKLTVQTGDKKDEPSAGGPPPIPITAGMTSGELGRALDGYLSSLAAADTFSGVALVAKDNAAVFEKAYGFADRANKRPNSTSTRFNIGSINKSFTRMAIDQLVGEGKLKYTDTLGAVIPDYPQATSRPATVAQLLNHTAGLADFFGPEFSAAAKDRFRSNADYFRFVASLPPLFAPGARNRYCNGCYIALGAIIERVAGGPVRTVRHRAHLQARRHGEHRLSAGRRHRAGRRGRLHAPRRRPDAPQQRLHARRDRQRRGWQLLDDRRSAGVRQGPARRPTASRSRHDGRGGRGARRECGPRVGRRLDGDCADQPGSAHRRTPRRRHHGAALCRAMKIVVIEDDAVVSDTIALYLQQDGFDVVTARDGVTGLQLASAADASLVVLDLMIPGLPGLEVCRRLRATSTVPILMLTARVSEDDRLAGFDAGADDYVPKPFSPREVVARVQALLRRTSGGSSTPPAPIAIGDLEIDLWAKQVRRARPAGTAHRHRVPGAGRPRAPARARLHARGAGGAGVRPRLPGSRSHG